jgi:CRP-like cAMP-binding protein
MHSRDAPANILLAALADSDFILLKPHLKPVSLKQSDVLQEQGRPVEHVYFPTEGMLSMLAVLESGEGIEIAAIGREGAVGAKLGIRPVLSFTRTIVELPGQALRIPAANFQNAVSRSVAIAELAMRANEIVIANMQQAAACNALHGIEARLARWLLHARDRNTSDALPLTQEFLSQMLGVRRSTVTLAARVLQGAGLVRYRRGRIEITDRDGLRAMSCECYESVRRNIETILQVAGTRPRAKT